MHILILILATWRLARLLADEAGPFDILGRLRHLAGVRYDDVGSPYGSNELARGLMCVWCSSVWIGGIWALGYYLIPGVTFWLALPLALSGGATMSIGAWLFMISVFIGGYSIAFFIKKVWN